MATITVKAPKATIKMHEMRQGQFGRIVDHKCIGHNGEIVMCVWGSRVVSLDSGGTWSWDEDNIEQTGPTVEVQLLPPGTTIEIVV